MSATISHLATQIKKHKKNNHITNGIVIFIHPLHWLQCHLFIIITYVRTQSSPHFDSAHSASPETILSQYSDYWRTSVVVMVKHLVN